MKAAELARSGGVARQSDRASRPGDPAVGQRMVSNDAGLVADLIGDIYEAAAEPAAWADFLESLAAPLKLSAANIVVVPTGAGADSLLPVVWGLDEGVWSDYLDYYGSIDPWAAPASAEPVGAVAPSDALLPDALTRRTAFYNDYYARAGLRRGFGVKLAGGPGSPAYSCLAGHRDTSAGEFDAEELALVQRLVPHLQRSHQLSVALGHLDAQTAALSSVLDRLPVGVILVDEHAQIVRANRRAEQLLLEDDGLTTARCELDAIGAVQSRVLHRSIAEAIATGQGALGGSGAALRIPRPSGGRDLSVLVCPVNRDSAAWQTPGAFAVVAVSDGTERLDGVEGRLRALHGLTAVESDLACRVANGATLKEVADARDVALDTVRKQLKQVFGKMGVTRQSELVRQVLLGPALLSDL